MCSRPGIDGPGSSEEEGSTGCYYQPRGIYQSDRVLPPQLSTYINRPEHQQRADNATGELTLTASVKNGNVGPALRASFRKNWA